MLNVRMAIVTVTLLIYIKSDYSLVIINRTEHYKFRGAKQDIIKGPIFFSFSFTSGMTITIH